MVDELELQDLRRRIGKLEGALDILSSQLGAMTPGIDRLGTTTRTRFDTLDATLHRVVGRLDTMNTQVWSLRDDLPDLLATALRKSRQSLD
jgi:hypothetical protein